MNSSPTDHDNRLVDGSRWRRILRSFGITLICLYGPFSWLLLTSDRWDDRRQFWMKIWPILPGLLAGAPFHPRLPVEFAVMAIATLALVILLTYVGTRGRFGIIAAAAIALLTSVPTAFVSYGLFRF